MSLAAGTAVVFTLPSTGWVLSAAAAAMAFIPNAVGTALTPNEKRFSDRIETVTVDSVFSWLNRSGLGAPARVIR